MHAVVLLNRVDQIKRTIIEFYRRRARLLAHTRLT